MYISHISKKITLVILINWVERSSLIQPNLEENSVLNNIIACQLELETNQMSTSK